VTGRARALFAAMSLVWGIPYLLIKVAVDDGVPPLFVAWARVALGALVLLPIAAHAGALRGLRQHLGWVVTFAVFEVCIPFPLIAYGELHVPSSLAAILIASLPLIVAVISLRVLPEERVDARRLAGMLVGFAGVVLLVGIDLTGSRDELLGALWILVATCGYAIGPMIIRRKLSGADPRGISAAALATATILLAPAAVLTPPAAMPSGEALAALAGLGVICSALAFVLFFALIVEAGPSRASVVTYLNPAVAILLGVTLLDERLGAASIGGLALILAGSWSATGGRGAPAPRPAAVTRA
jgi:drug/metabolite transporter (DMT)-like permease